MLERTRSKAVGRVAMDGKKRVSLARAMRTLRTYVDEADLDNLSFRMEVNEVGQVILTPEVSIPAHELWLYRNPTALESVQRGLREAEASETLSLGSFSAYADDDVE